MAHLVMDELRLTIRVRRMQDSDGARAKVDHQVEAGELLLGRTRS